jgi:hypothetical protein
MYNNYYCSKCGTKLVSKRVFANVLDLDKYSKDTGKRLYVTEYSCPNQRFWNFHDYYWDYLSDDINII